MLGSGRQLRKDLHRKFRPSVILLVLLAWTAGGRGTPTAPKEESVSSDVKLEVDPQAEDNQHVGTKGERKRSLQVTTRSASLHKLFHSHKLESGVKTFSKEDVTKLSNDIKDLNVYKKRSKEIINEINVGKIQSGKSVEITMRPWAVFMRHTEINQTSQVGRRLIHQDYTFTNANASCTGSIVGDRWVLTAAQCVDRFMKDYTVNTLTRKPIKIEIVAGKTSEIGASGTYITLKEGENVFYHSSYKRFSKFNLSTSEAHDFCYHYSALYKPDLALLKFDKSLFAAGQPGADKAKAIRLPNCEERKKDYFYGRDCFASGWGDGSNQTLKEAEMKLEDPLENFDSYNSIFRGPCDIPGFNEEKFRKRNDINFFYKPTTTYLDNRYPGGPLACKGSDGQFVLAGVAHVVLGYTRGNERSDRNFRISIHYRTGPYADWINSVIGADGSSCASKARGQHQLHQRLWSGYTTITLLLLSKLFFLHKQRS